MSETFKVDSSGLHKFLLGPFYLFEDLVGALVPGIVLFALLSMKRVTALEAALAVPYLGYKTKLAIGVLLAYVAGKVFQIPSLLALDVLVKFGAKPNVAEEINLQGPIADVLKGRNRNLVTGFVLGLLLPGIDAFDQLVLQRGGIAFYISTGLVLLTASFVPGDGGLARLEGWAGILLLLLGVVALLKARRHMPMSLGMTIANAVLNRPDNYETRARMALTLLLGRSIASLRDEFLAEKPPKPTPPDRPSGTAATRS